jgi:hypothetical protein
MYGSSLPALGIELLQAHQPAWQEALCYCAMWCARMLDIVVLMPLMADHINSTESLASCTCCLTHPADGFITLV